MKTIKFFHASLYITATVTDCNLLFEGDHWSFYEKEDADVCISSVQKDGKDMPLRSFSDAFLDEIREAAIRAVWEKDDMGDFARNFPR